MNNLSRISIAGQSPESNTAIMKLLVNVFENDLALKVRFVSEQHNSFSVIVDESAKGMIDSILKAREAA